MWCTHVLACPEELLVHRYAILLCLLICGILCGGEALENKKTMNLWPGKAPGALGEAPGDTPVVQAFVPAEGATGSSIVVCPGGGYGGLANHEGPVIGEWLA